MAQQHVQPRKKSRKSQTATELIEQKTKGHFTTALSLLPNSTYGPGARPHRENLADRRRRAPGKETSISRAALTRSRGFKSPTRVGLDQTLHVTEERGQAVPPHPTLPLVSGNAPVPGLPAQVRNVTSNFDASAQIYFPITLLKHRRWERCIGSAGS